MLFNAFFRLWSAHRKSFFPCLHYKSKKHNFFSLLAFKARLPKKFKIIWKWKPVAQANKNSLLFPLEILRTWTWQKKKRNLFVQANFFLPKKKHSFVCWEREKEIIWLWIPFFLTMESSRVCRFLGHNHFEDCWSFWDILGDCWENKHWKFSFLCLFD